MLTILPRGQDQARTRWGTHESGAAFDKKKQSYLNEQAQEFLAQQSFCVITGLGTDQEIHGWLAMERPGFARVLDQHTCLIELSHSIDDASLRAALQKGHSAGKPAHIGIIFIHHASRERLCVQGEARLVPASPPLFFPLLHRDQKSRILLHIRQAFFHCSKYIRTHIAGLTAASPDVSTQGRRPLQHLGKSQHGLTEEMAAFIRQQELCFLCTVDHNGHGAVNHRGGKPGFLVPFLPNAMALGGVILLPDYMGNGAFEAIGNILETHQAALLIPNYAAQVALCVAGFADVIEMSSLPMELRQQCIGAKRVLALRVRHVEMQGGGHWSATLAYEQERAQAFFARNRPALACPC